jgi:hypothetical protein
MFFPVGNYEYYANPKINDLYSNISDNFSDEQSLKLTWLYRYNRPYTGPFDLSDSDGKYSYNDKIYSKSLEDSIKDIKNDYSELSDKNNTEMKALMEWVPDVSWEDYLKENIGLVQEKDVTLGIVLKLGRMLEKNKDYKIIYTRKIDEYPSLADRTDLR